MNSWAVTYRLEVCVCNAAVPTSTTSGIQNGSPSAVFGIFPSFLHILEVRVLSLTKIKPLPPSSSGCTCMPAHETPLLHTCTHTHTFSQPWVKHARTGIAAGCGLECVPILRIAQREGGDSVLAGSPAPRAKIGSCKIKIAVKREVPGGEVPLFSPFHFFLQCCFCKVSHAAFTPAEERYRCVWGEKEREGMMVDEVADT